MNLEYCESLLASDTAGLWGSCSACGLAFTSRIHLTRWAVTALAEKHRRQDHRPGLPGPRRTSPAGDANVRHVLTRLAGAWTPALALLLAFAFPAQGTSFRDNVQVERYGDCLVLIPAAGGQSPVADLRDFPDSLCENHTVILVTGVDDTCSQLCNGVRYSRCIRQTEWAIAAPESLGCGVLTEYPHFGNCWYWVSSEYGRWELYESGPYADGDTLAAVGWRSWACFSYCMLGGCLWNPTLTRCGTATPTKRLSWGVFRVLYR
jgi:hypothetical protein